MTPGWTSRREDAIATVQAARRWGRRRRTTADLADVKRLCAALTPTLTALVGVVEDTRKGVGRYLGGVLLIHDGIPGDRFPANQEHGEAALQNALQRLRRAQQLLDQAVAEIDAVADEVGPVSSTHNNDDLADSYALVDRYAATMLPRAPRKLTVVPSPDDTAPGQR